MLRLAWNSLRRQAARVPRAVQAVPSRLCVGEDPVVMASNRLAIVLASHEATTAHYGRRTGERGFVSTGNEDQIDDMRYHKEADHTLEYLVETFENLLDAIDVDDTDVELSQGVLNLNLGSIGTYVINKQTPNKQIWVSSPVSGPMRFDFVKGFWTYKRDGHLLHQRLEEEIKALTGVDIDLNPCSHCGKRNACADNYECVKI